MATDDLPCMQVLTTARYPRRYKHFNLLDQLLRKEFGPLVPQALPAKRAFGNLHPSFVEERRVALERYLQQCVAIPALAASSLFCHFVEADVKEGADFGEDETALHQSLHRVCTKQVGAAQWRLIAPEWRLIAPEWRRIATEWRLIATEWRLIAHESTPEWHSAYLIASHCLDSHPIASVHRAISSKKVGESRLGRGVTFACATASSSTTTRPRCPTHSSLSASSRSGALSASDCM